MEDYPTPILRSAEAILQENAITHDLYTAMTSVNLHPDSDIKRGVESSMKSLPSSFKFKVVYVSNLYSNEFAAVDHFHSSLIQNNMIPWPSSAARTYTKRNILHAFYLVHRAFSPGRIGTYLRFVVWRMLTFRSSN